jgi:tetratricopeptide (TPR) repeat protein
MRLGRNESALKLFYRTADQTYDRDLQSTAYWLIAQLCLEAHRLPESIKAAGRSLALAQIDEQKRLAALTLARAYLISNQPLSANQILFDNRQAFAGSSLETSAAVVGCLARYVGMSDKSNLNSEANRLLMAIAAVQPDQYGHFLDLYIAARAWLELGFRDKAIEMLTLAADSTNLTAWRRQFLFELAVQLAFSEQPERAIPVLEFLVSGEEDGWMDRSLIQLGSLYIQVKKNQEAIAVAERLLQRPLEEELKIQVLQFMGKAYRQMGQHHAAASCFAGLMPKVKPRSSQ